MPSGVELEEYSDDYIGTVYPFSDDDSFKTLYDENGKAAGTYVLQNGAWVK